MAVFGGAVRRFFRIDPNDEAQDRGSDDDGALVVESKDIEEATDDPSSGGLTALGDETQRQRTSPIIDEICGKIAVLARRHQTERDIRFLEALRTLVRRDGFSLRTMPKAVVAIQKMLGSKDVHIARLSAQLRLEPSLATRVVSIANCSLFGGQGRVGSVQDAIVRLGMVETRDIILAITAKARLFQMPEGEAHAQRLYRHALGSAVAGKVVADHTACAQSDEAFLACLLSELGRIVIYSAAADLPNEGDAEDVSFEETLERAANDLHGPVSALIADSWGFDAATVSAIHFHHRPSAAPAETRALSQLMFVADDLSTRAVDRVRLPETLSLVHARKALGVAEHVDELAKRTNEVFQELIQLIED